MKKLTCVVSLVLLGFGHGDAAQPSQSASEDPMDAITWIESGSTAQLGRLASFVVPESCRFTESRGARTFLEATENIPDGDELGLVICALPNDNMWFSIFSYDESGYVKDDEGSSLDADAILESIKRGTEAANEERTRRGWGSMTVSGWAVRPYYDAKTNHLTWSILGRSDDGTETVNHR